MEVDGGKKDDDDKTYGLSDQVVNTRVFIKIKIYFFFCLVDSVHVVSVKLS